MKRTLKNILTIILLIVLIITIIITLFIGNSKVNYHPSDYQMNQNQYVEETSSSSFNKVIYYAIVTGESIMISSTLTFLGFSHFNKESLKTILSKKAKTFILINIVLGIILSIILIYIFQNVFMVVA